MAEKAAEALSEQLHTRVEIGRIQLGLLGHIVIDDIHVWDRQQQPLLNATRTGAQIDLLELLEGEEIIINSAQLFGVHANIRQEHPDSAFNFQFILDAFASQDTTKKPLPHIEVHSILARHTNINLDKSWEPSVTGKIDPNHLSINDLSLKASLDILTDDTLGLEVSKLSFSEKCGMRINDMSARLTRGIHTGWQLHNLILTTSNSRLHVPFVHYTNGHADIALEARITPSDLSPVVPILHKADDAWHLNLQATADPSTITFGSLELAHVDNAFNLLADGELHYKDSIPTLQTHISNLSFTPHIKDVILPLLSSQEETTKPDKTSHETIASILSHLGQTNLKGDLSMNKDGLLTNLSMKSALGNIEGEGSYHKGHLKLLASTESFDVGTLLAATSRDSVSDIGHLTATVKAEGNIQGRISGNIEATINELQHKGYTYHDISLTASHHNEKYEARLQVSDPSVQVEADMRVSRARNESYIQGFANIDKLDLQATHLSQSPHILGIASRIGIDLQGSDFQNMEGHVSIPHFIVTASDTTVYLSNIQLISQPDDTLRHVTLHSPYLTAQAEGHFDILSLGQSIQQVAHRWLPGIVDEPRRTPASADAKFQIRLTNPEPLNYFAGMDIDLKKGPLDIDLTLQSESQFIEANVRSEGITLSGTEFQDVVAYLSGEGEDMHTRVNMKRMMKNTPTEFLLDLTSQHDLLTTRLAWDNHQSVRNDGEVILNGKLKREENGRLTVDANLNASQVHINDTLWNIHPTLLSFHDKHLYVDDFELSTKDNDRSLRIHGTASPHSNDSLYVSLNDIDLDYIFTIVTLKPVSFSGHVTGSVVAHSVFKNPIAIGSIVVPHFYFNKAHMGLLNAYLDWGTTPGTLSIRGLINDTEHQSNLLANCQIHLIKDPEQTLDIDVRTQRVNLAFVQRYLDTILDDFQGRASGHVRVFGTFKDVDIVGDVLAHETAFTITPLGTRYHTVNDSILIKPGRILFRNLIAYDREGTPGMKEHSAVTNGELTHEYFRRMGFNLNFDATHLLGYDHTDFGDMPFHATIYATGNVQLKGQPGRTEINVDATPVGHSTFTYNASGPERITKAGFLTFVDRSEELRRQLEGDDKNDDEPKISGDMYMNFNLHLTPDTELRLLMDPRTDDAISLFGNCNNLHATYYNKGKFQMYGTYRVDHGTYRMTIQDVMRKDFKMRQNGTIVFGGSPFEADLGLQAAYIVPSVSLNDLSAKGTFSSSNTRVDCIMNIGGTAGQPHVSFDFDIPNVNEDERRMVRSLISTDEERNMQVIYLLGIGRFYTYDYSGSQTQSETAMNSLLSSTLSDQLNNMFNNITNNTNWNFGANLSTGTMGWSDIDVEGMLSGRLLNNRLLINGNFGYRDNPVAASNFIGDFDVQYLLNKQGSIILKAYSETNDRYFTKSALTTQGIGILVKKDFTRLTDLFSFLRKKKQK